MDESQNLKLPYIMPSQAQKHVTHNEAIKILDCLVQLSVESRQQTAPPSQPVEGERYVVPDAADEAWANKTGQIATWQDGGWVFYRPQTGWVAWVSDESALVAWNGSSWIAASSTTAELPGAEAASFGINTQADELNRLSVKADGILFSHDDQTPGTGDVRQTLNKNETANSASIVFQKGYSTRIEMGLIEDDDFKVKVSGDGSSFSEILKIDSTSGKIGIGVEEPKAPLHVSGSDTALALENAHAPGKTWCITPGRSGIYADHLIVAASDGIGDSATHKMRIPQNGAPEFLDGVRITDGEAVGSNTSSALAFWRPFDGTRGHLSFRGKLNSGKAEYRISAFYHDGSYRATQVANWVASDAGPRLGIGVDEPTCTLHSNGPVRVGSYEIGNLPDASESGEGAIIYVSANGSGPILAFSNGTDWLNSRDGSTVF